MRSVSPILNVRDVAASVAYYRDVLGFQQTYVLRDRSDRVVHGMASRGAVMFMFSPIDGVPGEARPYLGAGVQFYVDVGDDDLDGFYNRVVARGATILEPLQTQFWGDRTFVVVDPDGYRVGFSRKLVVVSEQDVQRAFATTAC